MYTQLKEKLWAYIVSNNPDLMFNLQDEYRVVQYLEEKVSDVMPLAMKLLEEGRPGHAIHELCLNEMTKELKPSRYHYILKVLSGSFTREHEQFRESGEITYVAVNLVEHCKGVFDEFGFSEANYGHPKIRSVITSMVESYLTDNHRKS